MKLNNVKNVEELFKVIDQCKGEVYLVSKQGDHINLKSELAKYFTLAKVFSSEQLIKEIEIVASDPDDMAKLTAYLLKGIV